MCGLIVLYFSLSVVTIGIIIIHVYDSFVDLFGIKKSVLLRMIDIKRVNTNLTNLVRGDNFLIDLD